MFLFPFQVEFRIVRIPLVTMLVMLLCLGIYWAQSRSEARWRDARSFACDHADETLRSVWSRAGSAPVGTQCERMLREVARAQDPQAQLARIADDLATSPDAARFGGRAVIAKSLADFWRGAQQLGGRPPLTPSLVYVPQSWNPWHMITAALAHASWGHLLGNLFFFYLFATTIEGILGGWRFTALLLGLAIGTGTVYSLASLGVAAPPTLGLSGVVYGVMGLFAYFLPDARIRTFAWLLVRFWITSLSAWFIAVWYIGGDALSLLFSGNHGGVNLVAHVAGAIIGIVVGMTVFREDRDLVRAEARPHLQRAI